MPKSIQEQVVVITGASSGIGRETALQFADRGASVVLAARNGEALEEVARQVRERGGQALAVVTDVSLWEQVSQLAAEAVARHGKGSGAMRRGSSTSRSPFPPRTHRA